MSLHAVIDRSSLFERFDALEDGLAGVTHGPQADPQLLAILIAVLHIFVDFGCGLGRRGLQALLAREALAVFEIVIVDFELREFFFELSIL